MSIKIRKVDYFYTSIRDQPGEGYKTLSLLAEHGINLLAFTAVPVGPNLTQLTLFPEDSARLSQIAGKAGLKIDGPNQAILVQGDDQLGALRGVHEQLYKARVNVFAATGVTDGRGSYGYIIYIRPEEIKQAVLALDL